MGLIFQRIRLSNFARPELEEIDAKALVDAGAIDLCIPRHVANQLRPQKLEDREVTIANGDKQIIDYVAPVKIEVFGRKTVTGALVLGDQVLLGAMPMESMDVLIEPRARQLIPNPETPNIPGAMVVGVRSSCENDHA